MAVSRRHDSPETLASEANAAGARLERTEATLAPARFARFPLDSIRDDAPLEEARALLGAAEPVPAGRGRPWPRCPDFEKIRNKRRATVKQDFGTDPESTTMQERPR